MINLVEVETETRLEKAAGATTTSDQATLKGKLLEFSIWLSKQGYGEDVVNCRTRHMKRLIALGADLWNPESVKEILAKQQKWTDGYKMLISYTYESFLEMEKLTWQRPHYTQAESYPFIPAEKELDQLIATAGKKLGTFLQGLKDTGADPGELAKLRWMDINSETRAIQVRPVKGHNPRILKVSQQFLDRLQRLAKTDPIFNGRNLARLYLDIRKKAVEKFANPRLRNISFRTFRHWKGTMEYHRTRDILYVKKILGHKQISNTLKYINLEAMLFPDTDTQYIAKVALNVKEATSLVEAGFEYVTGNYEDGGKIFRKRTDEPRNIENFADTAKTTLDKTLSQS
jgi:integrase